MFPAKETGQDYKRPKYLGASLLLPSHRQGGVDKGHQQGKSRGKGSGSQEEGEPVLMGCSYLEQPVARSACLPPGRHNLQPDSPHKGVSISTHLLRVDSCPWGISHHKSLGWGLGFLMGRGLHVHLHCLIVHHVSQLQAQDTALLSTILPCAQI